MALSFEELKAIATEHGLPYSDDELREAAEAGARYEKAQAVVSRVYAYRGGHPAAEDVDDEGA